MLEPIVTAAAPDFRSGSPRFQRVRCVEARHVVAEDVLIVMLDEDGNVASWNHAAERVTGYAGQDIIGCHVSRLYAPEALEQGEPETHLQQAARGAPLRARRMVDARRRPSLPRRGHDLRAAERQPGAARVQLRDPRRDATLPARRGAAPVAHDRRVHAGRDRQRDARSAGSSRAGTAAPSACSATASARWWAGRSRRWWATRTSPPLRSWRRVSRRAARRAPRPARPAQERQR